MHLLQNLPRKPPMGVLTVPAVLMMLGALVVCPAWAQTGPTQDRPASVTFSERVNVDLVQLEVTVTDGEGARVTDLGRDDFQVRYGGKKVDLTLFSAVRQEATADGAARPAVPEDSEEPTFVVLLVDRDHLDGGLPDDGLSAVGEFVDGGLAGADRAMVLAAGGADIDVVLPFTADAGAVMDALRGLDLRPSPATAAMEYRRLIDEIRRVENRPDTESLSRDELPIAIKAQIEALSQKVYRELAQLTLHVDRAISGMAGLPGRKELVLVTGSLPNRVSKRLDDAWNDAFGYQSDLASRPSLTAEFGGVERLQNHAAQSGVQVAHTGELFDILARRANAQGVTLHVLGSVVNTEASRRVDDPAFLARLAKRTGGRAVIGQKAHRVLAAVRDDLRSYYLLAFSPPAEVARSDLAAGASGPVAVEVRLGRQHRGLEVGHREAVRPVNLEERATLAAVSALLLGSEGGANSGGLGLTVGPPTVVEGRDDVLRLPVAVLIPLRHMMLVAGDGADSGVDSGAEAVHQGRASLFFTTGDLAGGAGEVQKVVLPLQLTADQMQGIEQRNIEYTIDVPMGPHALRVAVAVRDDLSGAILATSVEIQRFRITP